MLMNKEAFEPLLYSHPSYSLTQTRYVIFICHDLFVFRPTLHWFLFSIELFGILIVNSIFIAVVTNYYTQCELILFYVKGVAFKLQEKSIELKNAMKVSVILTFLQIHLSGFIYLIR